MGSDPLNLGGLNPLISETSANAPILEEVHYNKKPPSRERVGEMH